MRDHPCELRADFQQYYGLNFDGMGDEYTFLHAADLAVMLPWESRCARVASPGGGWSSEAMLLSAVEFRLHQIVYSLSGGKAKDGSRLPKPEPLYNPGGRRERPEAMDVDQVRELLARPRRSEDGD